MDLMPISPESLSFTSGAMDETDLDLHTDTDLAVGVEGPRLGPGPGHPEVMAWARAM